MPEKKKTVTLSASVDTADCTVDDIVAAQKFVGAPSTAKVSIGSAPPAYNSPVDGAAAVENLPYSVTFSWSEEK